MRINRKELNLKFYEKKLEISKKINSFASKLSFFAKNDLKLSLAYLIARGLIQSGKSIVFDLGSESVWIYANGFLINFALGLIFKASFSFFTVQGQLHFLAYGIILYMIENFVKKIYQNKKEVAQIESYARKA